MKALLLTLALSAVAAPASAAWIYQESEDAFSDEKTAVVIGADIRGFSIGAKCWQGDPEETTLMIITPVPYDASAGYDTSKEIKLRTDSGETRDVEFLLQEMGGKVGFTISAGSEPGVYAIVREWAAAQKRVAMLIGNASRQIEARGSTKEVRKFLDFCSLPEG